MQGSYYNFLNDRPLTDYKYNLYHENYTYGLGMKYIVNKKAYIDAVFTQTITSRLTTTFKKAEIIKSATEKPASKTSTAET